MHSKFASYLEEANNKDLKKEVLEGAIVTIEVVNRETDPRTNETIVEDGASQVSEISDLSDFVVPR